MAKERLKSPRARLFVALDLPEPVREGLAAWQREQCADPALRPVQAAALHVTLCFLGYHPEGAIERIGELIRGIGPRRCGLRFDPEPAAVPPSRPRLYAAGAESPATVELQAELSEALSSERLYRPEKRPFWPHVTLARVRPERPRKGSGGRRRGRPQRVEDPPGRLPEQALGQFDGVRVTLYRSILRPEGAQYASLDGVDLPREEDEMKR